MKLLLTCFLIFSASAQASYFATHCSNASATIKWESGHNDNMMTIRYYEDEFKDKQIELYKVAIQEGKQLVLKDETFCRDGLFSKTKIYATTVTITPSPNFPTVLDFYGETPIKTEVICQYHMNGRGNCREN